jgi:hypothetical protein
MILTGEQAAPEHRLDEYSRSPRTGTSTRVATKASLFFFILLDAFVSTQTQKVRLEIRWGTNE